MSKELKDIRYQYRESVKNNNSAEKNTFNLITEISKMTSTINELRSKLEKYEINTLSDEDKLKNKKLDDDDKDWLDKRKDINYENSLIQKL